MSADHFEIIMELLLERQPFRAFTVRLKSGERLEIDHPTAINVIGNVAVFNSPGLVPNYFGFDSVSNIVDAPARDVTN
jgi:hypothetical protein